jgi:hypothetical protein
VREAARRAGTSPTATARALASLTSAGLIDQAHAMLARGCATETTVYQVPFASPRWLGLAPTIARVQLPGRYERKHASSGLAWGSRNLPASAWEHAAATRGLEPAQRALARNLARNALDAF